MKIGNVEKLRLQVQENKPRLLRLSDEQMQKKLGTDKWTGKEILGHLSDSATMNRQRIVRSQYEEPYEFPFYDQAKWTHIQAYNHYRWVDLVRLWEVEYQHLLHILDHLPDECANDPCPTKFSSSDWVTLDWLIGHIFRHSDHHLQQMYWLVGESDLPDDRELYHPIEDLP